MKRIVCLLLIAVLAVSIAGCTQPSQPATPKVTTPEARPEAPKGPVIGIVTGTVSQGEDEYRAGEKAVKKYGSLVKHVTYPDNFTKEQETTIAQMVGLASEPTIKAMVVCQGVPGTIAAIKKVREKRPDVKWLVLVPMEDPKLVNEVADLVLETDVVKRGETIIQLAKKMGATRFLHYSFPRHMSMQLLAERKEVMEKTCKQLGMEFIMVTAPDPLSDAGLSGAQKFVLEDVPRKVKQYGKNTAFFSTNCGMQEPMIRATLEAGAIFPEQCCPSPTHGYPGALGLKITPEIAGDIPKIRDLIKAEVAKKGGTGRFATWPTPINMVFVEAGVDLAKDWIDGKVKLDDAAAIKAKMGQISGVTLTTRKFDEKAGNYWLVISDSVIF